MRQYPVPVVTLCVITAEPVKGSVKETAYHNFFTICFNACEFSERLHTATSLQHVVGLN